MGSTSSFPRPSPGGGAERRRHVRFPVPREGTLGIPRALVGLLGVQRRIDVRVLDLSEGGAGLLSSEPIDMGTIVSLHIEIPELKDALDLRGRVARVVPPPPVAKDWIIGVEFAEVSNMVKLTLAGWERHFAATMVRKKEEGERKKELGLQ